jgi:hypothetical protein
MDGLSVVSSDHGNIFSQPKYSLPIRHTSHPNGIYLEDLVHVPWLITDYDQRKNIIAEKPTDSDDRIDDSLVEQRLKQLGYI